MFPLIIGGMSSSYELTKNVSRSHHSRDSCSISILVTTYWSVKQLVRTITQSWGGLHTPGRCREVQRSQLGTIRVCRFGSCECGKKICFLLGGCRALRLLICRRWGSVWPANGGAGSLISRVRFSGNEKRRLGNCLAADRVGDVLLAAEWLYTVRVGLNGSECMKAFCLHYYPES